jgi:hypothetical protein
MINRLFLSHPRSVGESFGEHFAIALHFGSSMLAGGAACLVHAFIPALFPKSASRRIKRLNLELAERERAFGKARATTPNAEWQFEYEI